MTVEQARSQYENAAVAIPQIENQIAQTENGLSILLGRNPGPIARGKTVFEFVMPANSGGSAVAAFGAASRYPSGRAKPCSRQRPDRGRQGPLLSRYLAYRVFRPVEHGTLQPFCRSQPNLELCRLVHRARYLPAAPSGDR